MEKSKQLNGEERKLLDLAEQKRTIKRDKILAFLLMVIGIILIFIALIFG